ncbi:UDP-N-acetyl-2-amino-2-deoxyglucuronate dehydrogenase [Lebetimonas natsushimae]|uniref:UDP-N-acetyl-2-amino-2-deoxyglucuronate dehydrogenase n=1 Tax=Lebetimonas natsushimae TaxID=1936991 RepID=A0A292YE66_9BACT|nr:Gfo/Idh/MocA family oxidoreductase [Lebetimonas natsushimae]GAX87601.1 UDP-N-acetyl-2-amino-2-deoxyglucuronate dehydrogenase [Lebetimonas natsushimae]
MNIALIGCGRISKKHIEAIKKNNLNLVAVCDIDLNKAKKIGVPYYKDYNEMLKKEKIDIVSILTPSGMHYKHALDVIEHKKHLIIEKPMTLRYFEAENLVKLAKKVGTKLFTVKQNRFNLPIKKIKESKNKLGKIFLATTRVRWSRTQEYYNMDNWRGTWEYDGGVISNQAIHHLDLLIYLVGDIESVYAKSINAFAKIETEDTAVATLKFKNGAVGTFEATTATRPKDIEGSISLLGNKGMVEIGGFAANKIVKWELDEQIDIKKYSQNPENVYGFGHMEFYKDVIESIEDNKKGICEMEEGIKSIKVMNAMYESIATNKEIFIDNLKLEKAKIGK